MQLMYKDEKLTLESYVKMIENNFDDYEIIPMLGLQRQQKLIHNFKDIVLNVIDSAQYVLGGDVNDFEKELIRYSGKEYAVSVGSCTDALLFSMMAYGFNEEWVVLTVPNSFYATTEMILRTGANPVFVDIDPGTHLMDIDAIEGMITEKVKAIVPVHLYGNIVDINKIKDILIKMNREDIIIIEDCAHAFGAKYNRKVPPLGDCGAFSFNPGKNCGGLYDAGAVITSDPEIAKLVSCFRDHGRLDKNSHCLIGGNSRIGNINNKVLTEKMKYIDVWSDRRREIAGRYIEAFKDIEDILTIKCDEHIESAYHQFVIEVENRDALKDYLLSNGIMTGIHYPLLITDQPVIQNMGKGSHNIPQAEKSVKRILSLPCFPELKNKEVDYIIEKISNFYNK